jgi:hypothetical protein
MKNNLFKVAILGLSSLLMASVSYAKCYPGLDCEPDLPGATKHPIETDWLIVDDYLVKDGLVKDLDTGLMWMRCSLGQYWDGIGCQGVAVEYSWEKAMEMAQSFDYGGYTDWRMPTRDELESLVFCSNGKSATHKDGTTECEGDYATPVIMQAAFPKTPISWFWTSSLYENKDDDSAWGVNFYHGASGYESKGENHAVRFVRNVK